MILIPYDSLDLGINRSAIRDLAAKNDHRTYRFQEDFALALIILNVKFILTPVKFATYLRYLYNRQVVSKINYMCVRTCSCTYFLIL